MICTDFELCKKTPGCTRKCEIGKKHPGACKVNGKMARPDKMARQKMRTNVVVVLACCGAATAIPPLGALALVDMFTANDEIDMLRFRLRLHQPLVLRTIVLESNMSHSGLPKPLHVRNALTADEIERFNVRLIQVPFTHEQLRRASCTNSAAGKCAWVLEMAQRRFVNRLMQEQIEEINRTRGLDNVLFHMSDLDELLDLEIVEDAARLGQIERCVCPLLRVYVYGEHCPSHYPDWSRSVLFRASSGWFEDMVHSKTLEGFQLRRLAGKGCSVLRRWSGWHFGYFMSSDKILRKLRAFAHAHDKYVFRAVNSSDPLSIIDHKAKSCIDIHGRKYGPSFTGFDGRLPPIPGWPKNPATPSDSTFSATALNRERERYNRELLKIGNVTKQGPTYAQAARQKMARIDAQLELLSIDINEELHRITGVRLW